MTLQELYREIGGSYERAIGVLRVEKLMDTHIRKLTQNGVAERVIAAGKAWIPRNCSKAPTR